MLFVDMTLFIPQIITQKACAANSQHENYILKLITWWKKLLKNVECVHLIHGVKVSALSAKNKVRFERSENRLGLTIKVSKNEKYLLPNIILLLFLACT